MRSLTVLISLFFVGSFAFSSDHIDGPVTKHHDVADLSDLYVFKSLDNPENVVFVLNTYPMVGKRGHFSEKVAYEFLLRQAVLSDQSVDVSSEEVSLLCSISEERHHKFKISCSMNGSPIVEADFSSEFEDANTGVKFYSDMVSDPFFLDQTWVEGLVEDGKLVSSGNSNLMSDLNVLTLVLEMPVSMLFSGANDPNLVMAVTARSVATQQNNEQLDWIGRPEITNFSMWPNDGADELRDLYNVEVPFQMSLINKEIYKNRITEKIVSHYDPADGDIDWTLEQAQTVSELFVNDFLLYAPNQACGGNDFLGIEEWLLFLRSDFNCGGRRLNDDIVDDILSFYITRNLDELGDGVSEPHKEVLSSFPYMREPSLGRLAQLKAWLARQTK